MDKQHVTKGQATPCTGDAGAKINIEVKGNGNDLLPIATLRGPDRHANAELIAEAFNTLHETGYTPAELAEQVQRLRNTMESVADSLTNYAYAQTNSKRGAAVKEAVLIEVRLLNTILARTAEGGIWRCPDSADHDESADFKEPGPCEQCGAGKKFLPYREDRNNPK